ncbi:MAG: hypothetical protein HYY67_01770 [Thaumarchaeota archaeon]|nr:hypothetical protein [Nitrososphaerota archaeon]MCS4537574.1 hypothetical protein [Nitrososphaerota archaeon]
MSTTYGTPRFRNLGDWLIWRSEGILGDFRMPACMAIISNEGVRDGWIYRLTDDDITRILARYKEHVNFWNIAIEIIRSELNVFANAIHKDYYTIASKFDNLQPKRIPREPTQPDFRRRGAR